MYFAIAVLRTVLGAYTNNCVVLHVVIMENCNFFNYFLKSLLFVKLVSSRKFKVASLTINYNSTNLQKITDARISATFHCFRPWPNLGENFADNNLNISFNKNPISSSVSVDCGLFTSTLEMVIYNKEQCF